MVLFGLSHLSRLSCRLPLHAKCLRMASAKPVVIFVLGGPGAGKGTQCSNIVRVRKTNINIYIELYLY